MDNNINTSSMLRVGTVLHDTYRIDGYLSSGGFGNTYMATNVEFNERYAIKEFFMRGISERGGNNTTVSVSNAESEATFNSQREKFKKEARRLRRLNSDHIVRVYDLFEENGTAYYVMDFIDGESLSARLKRTGTPLSEGEVLKILPQILDALEAAHNYRDPNDHENKGGILHLDLKPANIMVDKQGNVKLIDFGASKQQSASGGATTSSAISYTNGYAPREQMEQNLDKFGPWTDFYALGATLYALLTNKKPPLPSDIDDDETSDKHLALSFPTAISDKTKHLVLWLMTTNRKQRPQSVGEILDYLANNKSLQVNKGGFGMKRSSSIDNSPREAPLDGRKDNGSDETLVADKKDKQHDNKGSQAEIGSKPSVIPFPEEDGKKSESERKHVLVVLAIAAIITIIIVSTQWKGYSNLSPAPMADSDTTALDTATYVSNVQCRVQQGDCTYTGYVNDSNVPDGEGEAWFSDGRYYKGNFANGIMVDDDAFFKFPNGDTYQGSFVNDHFSKGRYTIKEDGSFFDGTYDNQGQPKKGTWYDKKGNKIQNV